MRKRIIAGAATVAAVALLVTGCGNKFSQQYNDAPRTPAQNRAPAEVITFPDGFSNAATKCDHGNRVYVIFHSDSSYGGIAVVPNDPTCQ